MTTIAARLCVWLGNVHTRRTRRYLAKHTVPKASAVSTRVQ